MNVADAGAKKKGEIDRWAGNLIAYQVEDEGPGGTLANHRDRDVRTASSLEEVGDRSRIHSLGGLAVYCEDLIARPDACLIRRGALEGIKNYDLGLAVCGGLRLDRHAHAIVFSVLIFAHLSEGLWIVEVRVWIQDVKHTGDG